MADETPSAPFIPAPIQPLTQADLLAVFDRILPPEYLEPLKSPGPGYELLQAFAAMLARTSVSVSRGSEAIFVLSSVGGAKATGEVELYRAAAHPTGLAVEVRAGTVVKASASGVRFLLLESATFGPADLGPFTVAVEAEAVGYRYNVTGERTLADGDTVPGEIDTIDVLVETPDFGDPTIQVRQVGDTTGGVDASLDQNGLDRGIRRVLTEGDDTFRGRVRSLPDTVSPDAFRRQLLYFAKALGIEVQFDFIETWQISYQTCYDAPSSAIPGSDYDPNLFCYDDPRSQYPFRNRWLGENDYRGGVIVVVPDFPAISDVGMAYDDTAANPADLQTILGSRAVGAYDVPSGYALSLQGGYDGFDLGKQTVYKSLWDQLQAIKAAGVSVAIELKVT